MAQQSGDEVTPFGPADAIMPKDMARHAERSGADKAEQDAFSLFALAMLAGAYVAFGATFAAAVTAGFDGAVPAGFANLVGGLAFTLAYVLAIVGGAELFTTNVLMMMAWAHGRLPTFWLLRAWSLVFAGNFLGAATTALLLIAAGQHAEADGAVAASLLASAARIDGLTVTQALLLGLLGNTLLCLGVWLTNSARTTTDRILALTPPVAAFYALGLEHAVALLFYLAKCSVAGAPGRAGFLGRYRRPAAGPHRRRVYARAGVDYPWQHTGRRRPGRIDVLVRVSAPGAALSPSMVFADRADCTLTRQYVEDSGPSYTSRDYPLRLDGQCRLRNCGRESLVHARV